MQVLRIADHFLGNAFERSTYYVYIRSCVYSVCGIVGTQCNNGDRGGSGRDATFVSSRNVCIIIQDHILSSSEVEAEVEDIYFIFTTK